MTEMEAQLGRVTSPSSVIEWVDENEAKKPGLCCLQGCLAGSSVGFSFFVALPTGIILVVLSSNNKNTALLAVGSVLIVLPFVILLVVILLCFNQNKLSRLKFWRKKTKTIPNVQNDSPKNDINSNTLAFKSIQQFKSMPNGNTNTPVLQPIIEQYSHPTTANLSTDHKPHGGQEVNCEEQEAHKHGQEVSSHRQEVHPEGQEVHSDGQEVYI